MSISGRLRIIVSSRPPTVDIPPREVPLDQHIAHRFGATSAATPYVTGTVACMMAANPELNPLTATSGSEALIPARILEILKEAAYVPADLDLVLMSVDRPSQILTEGTSRVIVVRVGTGLHIRIFDAGGGMVIDKRESELAEGEDLMDLKTLIASVDFHVTPLSPARKNEILENAMNSANYRVKIVPATRIGAGLEADSSWGPDVGFRRNLINVYESVRQAASAVIVDFEDLGYVDEFGREDIDSRMRGPVLLENAVLYDELIPGDEDVFLLGELPEGDTLYSVPFAISVPLQRRSGFETESPSLLMVTGIQPTGHWIIGSEDATFNGVTREHFGNTPAAKEISIRYRGVSDSLYKVAVGSYISREPHEPDRFEVGLEGNNEQGNASMVGGEGSGAEWRRVPITEIEEAVWDEVWELCLDDLTFHSGNDVDWFSVEPGDTSWDISSCLTNCAPRLVIELDAPAEVVLEARSPSGVLLGVARADGALELSCSDYLGSWPIGLELKQHFGRGEPYSVKLTWSIPNQSLCTLADTIRRNHEDEQADRNVAEQLFDLDFLRLGERFLIRPEDLFDTDPVTNPAPINQFGQIMRSEVFYFETVAQETRELVAQMTTTQSARLDIWTAGGEFVTSVSTVNVDSPPERVAEGALPSLHSVEVDLSGLVEGIYFLAVSAFYQNESIALSVQAPGSELPFVEMLLRPIHFESALSSVDVAQIREVQVVSHAGRMVQAELLIDGRWRPLQIPFETKEETQWVPIWTEHPGPVRIRDLGSGEVIASESAPGAGMKMMTDPGVAYDLMMSEDLSQWLKIDSFLGTGGPSVKVLEQGDKGTFFQIRDTSPSQ